MGIALSVAIHLYACCSGIHCWIIQVVDDCSHYICFLKCRRPTSPLHAICKDESCASALLSIRYWKNVTDLHEYDIRTLRYSPRPEHTGAGTMFQCPAGYPLMITDEH